VLPRLQDMGVEPYQIAAGFRGAAAQRLVRRLCPQCRTPRAPNEAEILFARAVGFVSEVVTHDGKGCPACKGLGFKGRIAISEAFLADDALLRAVADHKTSSEVAAFADAAGLVPMGRDGLIKAAQGLTTIEEVMAAVDG
jgi:general secretion pathway protein E